MVVAGVLVAALPAGARAATPSAPASASHYDHMFVLVEENHGFSDVIGNPAAPNLNALAQKFGLATAYYGVSHPSEPNYVALLGGNTFGVSSDNPYWMNRVNKPSLITQLDQAGISWKAYLEALPYPGYQGICYPAKCNGAPDSDPLYVSKHVAIQNFAGSLNPVDWSRQVPIEQLNTDLSTGNVPAFSYVIPTECDDMHGDPPYCLDSGNPGDPQDQHLVAQGDTYLGNVVSSITHASFWAKGNNAITIVFDEGDDNGGCCDGRPGGGQVATVVVTSHGPRGARDPGRYNHYSLLSTLQQNFGLGCLEFTCDTARVTPMTPLFHVTGAPAIATTPLPVSNFPTPTPTPMEPTNYTTNTPSAAGWTVVPAPALGSSDNSLGGVAASSPTDVWAVGNYVPDKGASNQDATLTLAAHYDGTKWSTVPTPNVGPNFNTFYGVAAKDGKAWAVGDRLDAKFEARALIEAWDGTHWTVADIPQPGPMRDLLLGASAVSASDVWAVGEQQGSDGMFGTLAEHWDGTSWTAVPTPDPGTSGNHLYGVAALGPDDVWAVGQQNSAAAPDQGLIEHWDGMSWSVVPSPTQQTASALLDSVAGSGGQVWAVGEADDPMNGASPLVEQFQNGAWSTVALPGDGSNWTSLWGVTTANNKPWAVGTFVDLASGNNEALMLYQGNSGWSIVNAPNPGSGSNILGGVAASGNTLWAVGLYDNGGSNLPLIERHPS